MKASTPLKIAIEGNELVIRVGIDTIAWAFERGEMNNPHNDVTDDFDHIYTVTDPRELTKDVMYLLQEEISSDFDSTSTPLESLLDKLCLEAAERGCMGVLETKKMPKE